MPIPRTIEEVGFRYYTNWTTSGQTTTTYSPPKTRDTIARPIFSNRVGWRRLPQPARSAPLNYSVNFGKANAGNLTAYDLTSPNGLPWTTGYTLGGTSPSMPSANSLAVSPSRVSMINEATYKAKAKLFNSLKGEGANLANMLGERKQVANSISNLLRTVAYTARDLRRGNVTSAIRRMGGDPQTARALRKKDIANQWLSLQYGWKPLLSDVYDLVQGLHHRESTGYTVIRASASHMLRGLTTQSIFQNTQTGKQVGIRLERSLVKYMVRVRPDLAFAEPAALGFTNPLTVLWEVTPWSFVVDWALPIGRYLEQLTATHGWTLLDGCISSLYYAGESGDYSWSSSISNSSYNRVWGQSYTGGAVAYTEFVRQAFTSWPIPDLPRFKNPFSTGHVLNSLALLSQAFGRGKVYTRGSH